MQRNTTLLLAVLLGGCLRVSAQQADYPVIGEVRYYETSGVNEEFVELYNPTNFAVDLGGWKIQYKSSTGQNWSNKLVIEEGRQIGAHGFLLYGGLAVETEPDYPSANNPGLGNSGGHVRLVNVALEVVDLVGWGAADSPEGDALGSHARGGSFERKALENSTAADMAPGGAHEFEGNGWDSDDNFSDFVTHDAQADCSPQNSESPAEPDVNLTDGSGTAACSVEQIFAPGPEDFSITVTAGEHLLETVEVELPDGWAWDAVSLDGAGFLEAALEIEGNTARAVGAAVDGDDTGIFDFSQATVPMETGVFTLTVRTAVPEGTPGPIQYSPQVQVSGDPIPMSDLHENDDDGLPFLLGQTVVIRGTVTLADELGIASYLQDESGGMVCYSSTFASAVDIGDDVTVVGTVTHFNGLCELNPAEMLELHSTGNDVEPNVLTCADISNQGAGGEPYEGTLVRLNNITVEASGVWAGNTNYTVSDASGTTALRIDGDCDLVGQPIPAEAFDIIAVCSQYDYSVPHHSGYQVLPRFTADLIQAAGPGINGGPWESEHTTDGVTLSWTTADPGTTITVWGAYGEASIDSVELEELTTDHEYRLTGLEAGSPYWARVGSTNDSGTNMTGVFYVSTVSPPESPGTIEAYFTQDAETDLALPGNEANQNHDVQTELIQLIDAAESSLDLCIYSLNIHEVGQAVIAAHDRGVAVRFIYDDDHDQGTVGQIENAGVTVIDDSFGDNDGQGLQHNKFIIFDAGDEDPSNDKVWTGSLNLIDEPAGYGIHAKQNVVLIADQAVARAFTLEFNEMWGSEGMTPDPNVSRFGASKTNNTPHRFIVGGRDVEVWFSPGDNVSQNLVNYIEEADQSLYFCILVFTRNELNYAMEDRHNQGAAIRGVFDSEGDQYSEWSDMLAWGADIHVDAGSGILHHKYMTIDPEDPALDPLVITGSYNWSNSAEYNNNENVVAIHDFYLANQYMQEFAYRYHNAGGTADFVDVDAPAARPGGFVLHGVHPNPFNPATRVNYSLPAPARMRLEVYDLLGRLVLERSLGLQGTGEHTAMVDLANRASGVYLLRLQAEGLGERHAKMVLVK